MRPAVRLKGLSRHIRDRVPAAPLPSVPATKDLSVLATPSRPKPFPCTTTSGRRTCVPASIVVGQETCQDAPFLVRRLQTDTSRPSLKRRPGLLTIPRRQVSSETRQLDAVPYKVAQVARLARLASRGRKTPCRLRLPLPAAPSVALPIADTASRPYAEWRLAAVAVTLAGEALRRLSGP